MPKIILLFLIVSKLAIAATDYDAATESFKKLLNSLVAADTTNPPGNEERIVKILAERFSQEGIKFDVTEFAPGRQNIVARLSGAGDQRPVMVIAHIDVVGTKDQAWTTPNPHQVVEKEGYLYGRGVSDDLGMAAAAVEMLVLLKKSGVPLKRDVIVALTGDEESGGAGIRFILKNHPEQVNAGIAINEGGGLVLGPDGKPKLVNLQVGEKIYEDFVVTARGKTGHSSVPLKENSIYRLSKALTRLESHQFPIRVSPVLKMYLKERANLEKPELAQAMRKLAAAKGTQLPKEALKVIDRDLSFATLLRTTCVATMVNGGTKENALPPEATANINCRILPDDSPAEIKEQLAKIFQDSTLTIAAKENSQRTPASKVDGEALASIQRVTHQMWPGLPIIPAISRGATDSRFLRVHGIQSYGLNPIGAEEADSRRAHGIDERIRMSSIKPGIEYLHRLITDLAVDIPTSSE